MTDALTLIPLDSVDPALIDALRAAGLMPDFGRALTLHLVETSPASVG